jgi:hypothetical protein
MAVVMGKHGSAKVVDGDMVDGVVTMCVLYCVT